MDVQHLRSTTDESRGQATFGLANLRSETTGLPFIVFISQKDGAQHDVGVKISPRPAVRVDQMSSYSLRPYRFIGGVKLSANEEALLETWISLNVKTLVDYWTRDIEYTEGAIEILKSV